MGAFFLGILVGWAIEWVFFTYYWNPNRNETSSNSSSDGNVGLHDDCEKERQNLQTGLQDKDREISHLHARIAMLQEASDRSARQQASAEKAAATAQSKTSAATTSKAAPRQEAPRKTTAGKDDLKKVSGIGPKIADLMSMAGIDSFEQLAKSDSAALKAILEKAGTRYATADPGSWPKQAELLGAGDKDGLQKLIATLKK